MINTKENLTGEHYIMCVLPWCLSLPSCINGDKWILEKGAGVAEITTIGELLVFSHSFSMH